MELGYLLKKDERRRLADAIMWQAGMAILDMTNPAAREWYCGLLAASIVDMGVDCFKTDFGERIPVRDIALF